LGNSPSAFDPGTALQSYSLKKLQVIFLNVLDRINPPEVWRVNMINMIFVVLLSFPPASLEPARQPSRARQPGLAIAGRRKLRKENPADPVNPVR